MNKQHNLLNMDVCSLFVDRKIDEIIEIEKLLDAEIEKKKTELRSMVGDRYKDILHASESIKDMKNLSAKIVDSIHNVGNFCESSEFRERPVDSSNGRNDEKVVKERILAVQINLALYVNKSISIHLDKEDYLTCSELYLLGQNIHTGLGLVNSNIIHRIPLLKHLKSNLNTLKDIVVSRIIRNLESVELLSEQLCCDLIGLLLLQQSQNTEQLVRIFVNHRKIALDNVLNVSGSSSVRNLINSTIRCLITTIFLLFECFLSKKNNDKEYCGLIFEKLENIVGDEAVPILSKLERPQSQLDIYTPEIVREFKPQMRIISSSPDKSVNDIKELVKEWLEETRIRIKSGLSDSFQLVTNLNGLRLIREEANKVKTPDKWEIICESLSLPKNFNVWYFFFQTSVTERAESLTVYKIKDNLEVFQAELKKELENSNCKLQESDLRGYVWEEDKKDVNSSEIRGLSMRASGFSPKVIELCGKFDGKFGELLDDLSRYLYGDKWDESSKKIMLNETRQRFEFGIEVRNKRLVKECVSMTSNLVEFMGKVLEEEKEKKIEKTLFCVRLLQALTKLCPYFKKCCTADQNSMESWRVEISANLIESSRKFWEIWLRDSLDKNGKTCEAIFARDLRKSSTVSSLFLKWDSIEIQEQTEEKVFKSHIKVPIKISLILDEILEKLNEEICRLLPHTIPKDFHVRYVEENAAMILENYGKWSDDVELTNQNVALQLLFDVKFLTMFSVRRENETLNGRSQDVCDKLRSKIDPFDLDVFYNFLRGNVKRALVQSQVGLGCLLPSSNQLANLDILEIRSNGNKEQEKEPSLLAVSGGQTCDNWFPLLPVTAPTKKHGF